MGSCVEGLLPRQWYSEDGDSHHWECVGRLYLVPPWPLPLSCPLSVKKNLLYHTCSHHDAPPPKCMGPHLTFSHFNDFLCCFHPSHRNVTSSLDFSSLFSTSVSPQATCHIWWLDHQTLKGVYTELLTLAHAWTGQTPEKHHCLTTIMMILVSNQRVSGIVLKLSVNGVRLLK